MSHAIFLKNDKWAFFCIKKIKNDKNHFLEKMQKKIFPSNETVPKRQRYRKSVKNFAFY